jgi:5,10-methylenetetrahydrofolate reductase
MPARFPVGASYYGPEMTSAQLPSSPAVLPGTHAVRRQAFEQLHERAITLRRAGRSRREIKEILGITSNATLNEALRGEPPQAWTRRPRAKDDLHAQARQLREKGLDYDRRIEGWVRGAMAWPDTP